MNPVRMKVLVATGLYPPQIGGPATYAKLLQEALPARGFSIDVVNFGDVRALPIVIRHFIYGIHLFRAARGASVIYALDPVSVGLPAAIVSFLRRVPLVLKVVGDYAWEQGVLRFGVRDRLEAFSKRKRRYTFFVETLLTIERWVARRAKCVVVPSAYLKKIIRAWGVSEGKIKVIYNAFEGVSSDGSPQALRALMGFEGKLIVSAGRLVPWKGFRALVDVMPRVLKEVPQAKLVIIGDGGERDALLERVTYLHLEHAIILTGALRQDILHSYIRAADVFVLNSSYEGFSHLLLEVMALGTPIVTTKSGGNPELVEDGTEGLLIRSGDKKALANTLCTLLNDTALASRLSRRALIRVKHFSEKAMLSEITALLRNTR